MVLDYMFGVIVFGLTLARVFDPLLNLFEVGHVDRSTKSATVHKREETPTAIAGVMRIEEWTFTKL